MKRFVNALLGQSGPLSISASSESNNNPQSNTVSPVSTTRIKLNSLKAGMPSSSATSTSKPSLSSASNQKQDMSHFNAELVAYFGQQFPSLINELLVSLMNAATQQQQQQQQSTTSGGGGGGSSSSSSGSSGSASSGSAQMKLSSQNHSTGSSSSRSPDTFLQDVRCFKCGKFASKLKASLFRHLHEEHHFDMREMERLYEQHMQAQLQLIDEQHLAEKYERGQREIAQQQLALFKETRAKSDQQRKEALASAVVMHIDGNGQPTLMQLGDANQMQQQGLTAAVVMTDSELLVPGKKKLYFLY